MSASGVYETVQITGEGQRSFVLVLPRHGRHASELTAIIRRNNFYHQGPHLGVLILDYLRGRGTLVDIGANLGLGSIPAAVYGSNVVAVEPMPENTLCLSMAVLANRLRNIRVFHLAAGAERGIVGIAGSEIWGHVVEPGEGSPVMLLPLDDIVALADLQGSGRHRGFVKTPVLVKIDAEGSELAVLRGAARLIERLDPAIIVECTMIEGGADPLSEQARAVKRHLEENGYHLYLHRGDRLVPRRASDTQEAHVCDIFAARKPYREGDRIGRFTVGSLSAAESTAWLREMVDEATTSYRLHAAGVLARWKSEGHWGPELAELAERLIGDPDAAVAAQAARLFGSSSAR